VACNNTLLLLKEFDIQFFINREDAEDFHLTITMKEREMECYSSVNNLGDFNTNKSGSRNARTCAYKPVQDMAVQESSPSFSKGTFLLKIKQLHYEHRKHGLPKEHFKVLRF
jgi:hypothetical protein